MLLEQTLQRLRALKLDGIAVALEHQLSQPKFHQLSFEERLSLLVDREVFDRSNRRITGLLRKVRLRQHKMGRNEFIISLFYISCCNHL